MFYWFFQRGEWRERGGGRGRERNIMYERDIDQLPHVRAPTGDWTHNLDMYPDRGIELAIFLCTEWCPNGATWARPAY